MNTPISAWIVEPIYKILCNIYNCPIYYEYLKISGTYAHRFRFSISNLDESKIYEMVANILADSFSEGTWNLWFDYDYNDEYNALLEPCLDIAFACDQRINYILPRSSTYEQKLNELDEITNMLSNLEILDYQEDAEQLTEYFNQMSLET